MTTSKRIYDIDDSNGRRHACLASRDILSLQKKKLILLNWILSGNDPFPASQPRERALLELFLSQLTPAVTQDHHI